MIKLKQLEDDLLAKLSSAQGDLTEDEALIISLEQSKALADEISEKVCLCQLGCVLCWSRRAGRWAPSGQAAAGRRRMADRPAGR